MRVIVTLVTIGHIRIEDILEEEDITRKEVEDHRIEIDNQSGSYPRRGRTPNDGRPPDDGGPPDGGGPCDDGGPPGNGRPPRRPRGQGPPGPPGPPGPVRPIIVQQPRVTLDTTLHRKIHLEQLASQCYNWLGLKTKQIDTCKNTYNRDK